VATAAHDPAQPPESGSGARAAGWLALVAFFLLGAAWAVAAPYNGGYDEHDHVVRAAGVVRGQLLVPPARGTGDGGYQRVPASLVPPGYACLVSADPPPASCLGTAPRDNRLTVVHTRAARYDPAYYALVGWPLRWWPRMSGVIGARLVNAALGAALLAGAVWLLWPLGRYRLVLLGLLFALSPMLASLNGLVNPSGLAIDAAILLWCALLRILPPGSVPRPIGGGPTRLAALAGVVLALARAEGVVLVVAIVGLALLALGRPVAPPRRRLLIAGGAVALAAGLGLAWAMVSRVASVGAGPGGLPVAGWDTVATIVRGNFDYWLRQTVGLFGYGAIGLPVWGYVAWTAVLAALVLPAAALAGRRLAGVLLGIPVLCFAAGLVAELALVHRIGYWMQGRYFLPLWVGMALLAPLALVRLPAPVTRRAYLLGAAVWGGAQLLGLLAAGAGYRSGNHPDPRYPDAWHPLVGTATPYLLLAAALAATGALVHRWLREPGPGPAVSPTPNRASQLGRAASDQAAAATTTGAGTRPASAPTKPPSTPSSASEARSSRVTEPSGVTVIIRSSRK